MINFPVLVRRPCGGKFLQKEFTVLLVFVFIQKQIMTHEAVASWGEQRDGTAGESRGRRHTTNLATVPTASPATSFNSDTMLADITPTRSIPLMYLDRVYRYLGNYLC